MVTISHACHMERKGIEAASTSSMGSACSREAPRFIYVAHYIFMAACTLFWQDRRLHEKNV